jgi:ligand-binding sensor domain-containing protein
MNGVNYLSPDSEFRAVSGLAGKRVWSILEDREGHFWFGTFGGVIQYEHSTFASYRADRSDADDGVFTMLEDRDGHIWFAPFGGGVGYLDSDGGLWVLTPEDGLANPTVMSICQDKEGRMWVGLWDSGVCCYDPLDEQGATMAYFTELDGLAGNRVWHILQDYRDDTMWFGSWGGLTRYDGHRLVPFTAEEGLSHSRIRAMTQDRKGAIWVGSVSGVSYYGGDTFHTFSQQIYPIKVFGAFTKIDRATCGL